MEPTTSKNILVKESVIHHKGVFAAIDIPKDTEIIEYVGIRVPKDEGDKIAEEHIQKAELDPDHGSVYVFIVEGKDYDIDGSPNWNTAKYINHSCEPNCYIDIKDGRVFIYALRLIKKGDELTYNYGYDLEDFEKHPCRCGSSSCVGFIADEDEWPKLKELIKKKKNE